MRRSIERLLEKLSDYRLDQFPKGGQEDLEDDWYAAEEGARLGAPGYERERILRKLHNFIELLQSTPRNPDWKFE